MAIQLVVENMNAVLYGKPVLRDVAVTAEAGKILALMGKTGSGKSTFLRVINRMAEQYGAEVSGNITLNGSSIFMMPQSELRQKVGLVFTEPVLFSGSVLQNITAGLRLQGVRKKNQLEEAAEETLQRMGYWEDFRDELRLDASELTRSQAQVVCIARSLCPKPQLLLMDEPTRMTDTMTSIRLEEMLFNLKKDCTVVSAVHSPQLAGRIADKTAMMEEGEILEWGKTSDLFFHPKDARTQAFVSA